MPASISGFVASLCLVLSAVASLQAEPTATGPLRSDESFGRPRAAIAAHELESRYSDAPAATSLELPTWRDEGSVYLALSGEAEDSTGEHASTPGAPAHGDRFPVVQASSDAEIGSALSRSSLSEPAHQEPAPGVAGALPAVTPDAQATAGDARRLRPPHSAEGTLEQYGGAGDTSRRSIGFGLPVASIYSSAAALALVVGLFLLCAWMLRRGGRKPASRLPAEVVSVLGRVPLASRHFAELLRVGNKLVLVSLTPDGAKPLTEVTDPVEVDRLVGLCQQYDTHSTTKAFEDVFRQLSREPAPEDFLDRDETRSTIPPSFDPYALSRREVARG